MKLRIIFPIAFMVLLSTGCKNETAPAPAATPLTAATTGFGKLRMRFTMGL